MEKIEGTVGSSVITRQISTVPVHGPLTSSKKVESRVTLIRLIGQDLTRGRDGTEGTSLRLLPDRIR